MTQDSFFHALMDLSFSEFITTKLLKWLYIFGLLAAGLAGLAFLFASMSRGFQGIVVALVLAPLGFLLVAIMLRIGVEMTIVMFRIAENTGNTAREIGSLARQTGSAPRHDPMARSIA